MVHMLFWNEPPQIFRAQLPTANCCQERECRHMKARQEQLTRIFQERPVAQRYRKDKEFHILIFNIYKYPWFGVLDRLRSNFFLFQT
jgi:hypothetical protein